MKDMKNTTVVSVVVGAIKMLTGSVKLDFHSEHLIYPRADCGFKGRDLTASGKQTQINDSDERMMRIRKHE